MCQAKLLIQTDQTAMDFIADGTLPLSGDAALRRTICAATWFVNLNEIHRRDHWPPSATKPHLSRGGDFDMLSCCQVWGRVSQWGVVLLDRLIRPEQSSNLRGYCDE